MGQGVRTLLATVLTEEREVDPVRVHLEQALPGARFKGIRLRTSGSGSSSGTFRALRTAGASARQMLIAAAAAAWKLDAATCRAEQGTVLQSRLRPAPHLRRARGCRLAPAGSRESASQTDLGIPPHREETEPHRCRSYRSRRRAIGIDARINVRFSSRMGVRQK